MSETYWGIYCPQHPGSWYRDQNGNLYHYPSREIAEAHIESIRRDVGDRFGAQHLWQAVEFGKQEYVKEAEPPPLSTLCPVRE